MSSRYWLSAQHDSVNLDVLYSGNDRQFGIFDDSRQHTNNLLVRSASDGSVRTHPYGSSTANERWERSARVPASIGSTVSGSLLPKNTKPVNALDINTPHGHKKRPHIALTLGNQTVRPHKQLALSSQDNKERRKPVTEDPVKDVDDESVMTDRKFYAFMSKAAYFEGDENDIADFFEEHGLKAWKLDTDLSSQKNSVFTNSSTGEVVISYKGTNPKNVEDLGDDAFIASPFLWESDTSRFKGAQNLYEAVESKYGKSNISITGHSLGGSIAMHVGERADVPTFSYNPGISAGAALDTHNNNKTKSIIYRTSTDIVSGFAADVLGDNRRVVTVPQSQTGAFGNHALENFWEDKQPGKKTFEDRIDPYNKIPEVSADFRKINNKVLNNPVGRAFLKAGTWVEKQFVDVAEDIGKEVVMDNEYVQAAADSVYVYDKGSRLANFTYGESKGALEKYADAQEKGKVKNYDDGTIRVHGIKYVDSSTLQSPMLPDEEEGDDKNDDKGYHTNSLINQWIQHPDTSPPRPKPRYPYGYGN